MPPGAPVKSTRVWLPAVVAVAVLAVAAAVAWLVIPGRSGDSPTGASGPVVTGKAVEQVLLDGAALTEMLGQPFEKTTRSPVYPGPDEIDLEPSPGDCVGVANVAPQSVYQSAEMRGYARETWRDATIGGAGAYPFRSKVMFVDEAVVALPSAADAQALFATFSEQWRRCDGQPVNVETDISDPDSPPRLPGTEMHITDVRATDTVLAASIVLDKSPEVPDTRAVGVRGNCLVEVLIAFTGARNGTGSADPETSSSDVARAMMDKVDKLS